jgi:hypothetical protein
MEPSVNLSVMDVDCLSVEVRIAPEGLPLGTVRTLTAIVLEGVDRSGSLIATDTGTGRAAAAGTTGSLGTGAGRAATRTCDKGGNSESRGNGSDRLDDGKSATRLFAATADVVLTVPSPFDADTGRAGTATAAFTDDTATEVVTAGRGTRVRFLTSIQASRAAAATSVGTMMLASRAGTL